MISAASLLIEEHEGNDKKKNEKKRYRWQKRISGVIYGAMGTPEILRFNEFCFPLLIDFSIYFYLILYYYFFPALLDFIFVSRLRNCLYIQLKYTNLWHCDKSVAERHTIQWARSRLERVIFSDCVNNSDRLLHTPAIHPPTKRVRKQINTQEPIRIEKQHHARNEHINYIELNGKKKW